MRTRTSTTLFFNQVFQVAHQVLVRIAVPLLEQVRMVLQEVPMEGEHVSLGALSVLSLKPEFPEQRHSLGVFHVGWIIARGRFSSLCHCVDASGTSPWLELNNSGTDRSSSQILVAAVGLEPTTYGL